MRCIFCKQPSAKSVTVEHIVPESLGNKTHILPKGIVCDKCNNYFAVKVEKKALETDFFRNLRFRNELESKRKIVPAGDTFFPLTNQKGNISFDDKSQPNQIAINVEKETFNLILSSKIKQAYISLTADLPKNDQAISRMLAKAALEFVTTRFINKPEYFDFIVEEVAFDPIRNYARFNNKNETWPYYVRKIYDEDERFFLANGKSVDMVFECDFLSTDLGEMYFIIAFKGIEFALNIAGPSVEGYEEWLVKNNKISPLYLDGKGFGYKLSPSFMKKNDKT